MVIPCSLGQLMPLLDPDAGRSMIREVVQQVVWNGETNSVRLSLNMDALRKGFRTPIEPVMSACIPVLACLVSPREEPLSADPQ